MAVGPRDRREARISAAAGHMAGADEVLGARMQPLDGRTRQPVSDQAGHEKEGVVSQRLRSTFRLATGS